ncbi:hypothetical protein BGX28_004147 [Mortierella sp. GBA30]|nr:hypothetical protein BGX28_004147 [Mortierella sp. GBA30]
MLLNQSSSASSSSVDQIISQKHNNLEQQEEDHISKLDIRVGIVRSVVPHPDADSLYIEQVDVGDKEGDMPKEPRTIVSGLVRHVAKDYLEGRAVIVVGNMKPSKLRGVMSQGMLLCAMEQDANGEVTKVGLLEPAEGSKAGDKVTFEGFTDEDTVPAAVLTPKRKWFEKSRVHFSVQDGIAYYKGSPFRTVQGLVRCKSISKGQISLSLAPSLCLNADAIVDLAPVQPTEENLLPATFPTLSWSEESSADKKTAKAEKRLCYRHRPDLRSKRAADEIQLDELQQDIKRLPHQDQQIITHIWSLFGSAPASHRQLVLSGLLTQCCVPQLSFLSTHLQPLLRIDFLSILPPEIALRILSYLDATSLCHAAQVCKSWKRLADDDVVWHRMCEQHIGLKCTKCGWGLPLLEKKKVRSKRHLDHQHQQQQPQFQPQQQQQYHNTHASQGTSDESDPEDHPHQSRPVLHRLNTVPSSHPSPPRSVSPVEASSSQEWSPRKRVESDDDDDARSLKRARYDSRSPSPGFEVSTYPPTPLFQAPQPPAKKTEGTTRRPWKDIYSERLIVERNWRKRNYRRKEFRGHTDGVMCLQFDDSFLITGSYDNTAKVWNVETGECLRTLTGHALCVRALHFDEAKLITGSMDRTLKIWNYHTGQCIRTLQGHTDGVVTLDFDSRILASGSADATIKTWNFATGECATLKGHTDLVNKVQIYKKTLLFSASDDTTVKLWDIASRTCLRTFTGHIGRVQCLQTSGDALISILAKNLIHSRLAQRQSARSIAAGSNGQRSSTYYETASSSSDGETTRTMLPIVISGGLDNTLKVWNAESGECLNTLFGHEEGVWSLAFDKLRIVSGGLDKTVKVWDTESGECLYTLQGPDGPVTCVGLGDTKIAGGAADGSVFVWDYGVHPQQ